MKSLLFKIYFYDSLENLLNLLFIFLFFTIYTLSLFILNISKFYSVPKYRKLQKYSETELNTCQEASLNYEQNP